MKRPYLFLTLICIACYFLNQNGIAFSDEYEYARNSWLLSKLNGEFSLTGSSFTNRFGLIFPAAMFVKIGGVGKYILTLWPLLCGIAMVLVTYRTISLFHPTAAFISALLLSITPLVAKNYSDLMPDLVMTSFCMISFYIIFYVSQASYPPKPKWAVLAALMLFMAFLAKESVVLSLPFLLFIFLYQFICRAGLRKFWIIFMGISAACLLIYLFIYLQLTGDPLFRLHGFEGEHNSSVFSYTMTSREQLINRILFEPFVMMCSNTSFFIYLLLLVPFFAVWRPKHQQLFGFPGFFVLFFLISYCTHHFLSTSVRHYTPIPIQDRMWLLNIVPMSIIAGVVLAEPETYLSFRLRKHKLIGGIGYGLIVLMLAMIFFYKENKLVFLNKPALNYFNIFYLLYLPALWYLLKKDGGQRRLPALFVLPLILLQLIVPIYIYKKHSSLNEERLVKKFLVPGNKPTLVIADTRLAKQYSFYWGFQAPPGIAFIDFEHLPVNAGPFGKIFMLVNYQRLHTLNELWGYKAPAFVYSDKLLQYTAHRDQQVTLYEIDHEFISRINGGKER